MPSKRSGPRVFHRRSNLWRTPWMAADERMLAPRRPAARAIVQDVSPHLLEPSETRHPSLWASSRRCR